MMKRQDSNQHKSTLGHQALKLLSQLGLVVLLVVGIIVLHGTKAAALAVNSCFGTTTLGAAGDGQGPDFASPDPLYAQKAQDAPQAWPDFFNPNETEWNDGNFHYQIYIFQISGDSSLNTAGKGDVIPAKGYPIIACNYAVNPDTAQPATSTFGSESLVWSDNGVPVDPTGVELGAPQQLGDNNGLWMTSQFYNAVQPVDRPPVFANDFNSAAALVDDSGGASITNNNGVTNTLFCDAIAYSDTECPPDISTLGPPVDHHAGAGYLMTATDCYIDSPLAFNAGIDEPGNYVGSCQGSGPDDPFSWYDSYLGGADNTDLVADNLITTDANGNLQPFDLTLTSENTIAGGFGTYVYLTFKYPIPPPPPPPVFEPYLQVTGGDVSAGSVIKPWGTASPANCTDPNNNDGILTWNTNNSTGAGFVGSGTQLAAEALSEINGFASAQNSNPSITPTGLSFANTGAVVGGPPWGGLDTQALNSQYGGYFGYASCPPVTNSATATDVAPEDWANIVIYKLPPGSPPQIIYVTGNAYIVSNIEFTPATWTSPSQIPQFQLIVKGDIYIDHNVTELDGLYMAGGTIYDCTTVNGPNGPFAGTGNASTGTFTSSGPGTLPGGPGTYDPNSCDSNVGDPSKPLTAPLVINGSFVAPDIAFQRPYGSINGGNTTAGAVGPMPAEQFNYDPEQWLAGLNTTLGNPDSVTSLPPVL